MAKRASQIATAGPDIAPTARSARRRTALEGKVAIATTTTSVLRACIVTVGRAQQRNRGSVSYGTKEMGRSARGGGIAVNVGERVQQ